MSRPRPKKTPEHVAAVRRAASLRRWAKLTVEQRREAVEPAAAARRRTPGTLGSFSQ